MNDFAKTQLMKYGWIEGKGLGKHESGITQAIRPKLKFDTAGIGHNDKHWNNWWESGFNKAANSIIVESQTQGVSISVSKESANNDFSKKNLNEEKSKYSTNYSNFLKTSTLLNGTLTTENNSNVYEEKNIEKDITYTPLTDEELFKVCGGRTAHKGARHGLTLSGKLTRIAQQEENVLNTNSNINMSKILYNNNNEYEDDKDEMINNVNTILPITFTQEVIVPKVSKTVRKKNRGRINNLTHQLNILCNLNDNDEELALKRKDKSRKKKKKREKRKSIISNDDEGIEKEEDDNELDDTSFSVSQKFTQAQENDHFKQECSDTYMYRKKKKKEKKLKRKKNENNQRKNMCEDEELDGFLAKKLKRSCKSDSDEQFLIENKDISTSESIFKTKFSWNEEPTKSHKVRDLPIGTTESFSKLPDTYLKKKTDYLNAKIMKKKQAKLRQKEKKNLACIQKGLETVHFNNEESAEEKNTKKNLNTIVQKLMD
ncbi:PREDICTED: G patch domain-containing protein 4 [Habropoda laboriosa]|uniref:G patch domain-containing protein 4 n=1 Tax=Habropoda laboriosa TaxID=597456 RepID=UPI00083DCC97|nr:PREDICTED: G patch domain-containing protein 4 [Habropoda laboriosa]